jgi:hypothetical protein
MLPQKKLLTLAVLAFAFMFASQIMAQTTKTPDGVKPLPQGNWSIVYHPYLGVDYLDAPVIVQSVSSSKWLAAEKFEIRNISNKAVKAVKVRWLVSDESDPMKILRKGETKLLRFRNELSSGKWGFIRHKVVSFSDFTDSLLVKGKLDRSLDINLLVSEVTFADGAVWKWEDGRSLDINDELSIVAELGDCPKQTCVARPSTTVNGAVVYSCGPSTNNERCVNSGEYSCLNQSCNRPGGGPGGDDGPEIILD